MSRLMLTASTGKNRRSAVRHSSMCTRAVALLVLALGASGAAKAWPQEGLPNLQGGVPAGEATSAKQLRLQLKERDTGRIHTLWIGL